MKIKSIPYKRLVFAYLSMAGIIAFFVIAAQLVIQQALFQETSTRNLASTMALQELRTQATFRNSLLAILPGPYQTQMNALKVKPVDALKKNITDIEGTNQILIGPGTPDNVAVQMQSLQSDFYTLDQGAHQVIALLSIHHPVAPDDLKAASKQVAVLFPPEQRYLQGTYNAYQSLTASADDDILRVKILEGILCVASLVVLAAEVKLVVLPALNDYEDYKQQQEDGENKEETIETTGYNAGKEQVKESVVIDKATKRL